MIETAALFPREQTRAANQHLMVARVAQVRHDKPERNIMVSDLIESADQWMLQEDELDAVSGGIKEIAQAGNVVAYRSYLETMADDDCGV